MSGPGVIRLKRKRDQQPPDTLIVEPQRKRWQGDSASAAQYIRQQESTAFSPEVSATKSTVPAGNQTPRAKRVFKIRHGGGVGNDGRRRRARDGEIATVVEQSLPKLQATRTFETSQPESLAGSPAPSLKRPGRNAATVRARPVQSGGGHAESTSDSGLQALADSLTEFAEKENLKSDKPRLLAKPKLSGQQSRERHRQHALEQTPQKGAFIHDVEMAEDDAEGDYVYDTYILTSNNNEQSMGDPLRNVGYIVITDEDQELWETYLNDDASDKELEEDDEDENAEDWYGADYPEDEVASDDEYGRNAYAYRGRASDDEQWDEDTGTWSDEEYDRQMNPWKQVSSKN